MDKLMVFVGKVLFALPFIGFGIENVAGAADKAGIVPPYIPGGVFWIYFTGIAMILAALAILTGKQAREACLGLAIMLLVFIVTVHLPHLANPQLKVMGLMGLYKDTSMMGGALVLAATFKGNK
jgi:uncharacterized membrane protein YphA (DoxX/SURF4 family)